MQKVASLFPAFRQTSGTGVPSSAWRNMKAICASVNFDFFMPKTPSAARAAKMEFPALNGPGNRRQVRLSGLDHLMAGRIGPLKVKLELLGLIHHILAELKGLEFGFVFRKWGAHELR